MQNEYYYPNLKLLDKVYNRCKYSVVIEVRGACDEKICTIRYTYSR